MRAPRKLDLDHRLDGYFATLRSSSLRDAVKRSAGNWQIYAAVTGSAMAMATSASASIIGSGIRDNRADPIASVLAAKQHLAPMPIRLSQTPPSRGSSVRHSEPYLGAD